MQNNAKNTTDSRLEQLQSWLQKVLPTITAQQGWSNLSESIFLPASSDASFRRYFRWHSGEYSMILMDAPPATEDCRPFIKVAKQLKACGLHVPEILAEDVEQGFLALTVIGEETWLTALNEQNADEYFAKAIDALIVMQKQTMHVDYPLYDEKLLNRDLQLFVDWYVKKELKQSLTEQQQSDWQLSCKLLIDNALDQERCFVHRDFMPRNLMYSSPNPGILDFQDAVYGPVTYDIACLFKDAFISWPEARVQTWLKLYWDKARAAGVPVAQEWELFQYQVDLMGVQRYLKVVGIFARICHRDHKPKYVKDAPRMLGYIKTAIDRQPVLAPLKQLLVSLKVLV
ncbi:phosphotransferase [Pseudomonas sp. F1_0610]|uniref:aminoglycoside phosphotransferase family protein n=1 Tax=Pseudomonas sp. F1_0610 TaxID=3114284 RepID=UPI0039C292ED